MTSRERVTAMLNFQPVDRMPLEYHPCLRGLYEHGEEFRRLMKAHPGDFEDFSDGPIPVIPPRAYDPDGSYHEYQWDAWGVQWEYRIFKMTGHPKTQPLTDWAQLEHYRLPPHPYGSPAAMEGYRRQVAQVRRYGYAKAGWISIFEKMHALRPFEDVLMDLWEDTPEIHRLADLLVEYQLEEIRQLSEAGVDAIEFGDDFGMNSAMLVPPELWRHFFRPRYQRLIQEAKNLGKQVFFHSCGYIAPILQDMGEIGVDSLWPQLSVYEPQHLAGQLRELGMACAIHIDRANVMTRGTPQDVADSVHFWADTFDAYNGGAFFYVETDNGFPLENIAALLHTISEYR